MNDHRPADRWRLIAQNASDVISLARDGALTWISPSVTGALGGHPDDWVGVRLADLIHPDDIAAFATASTALTHGEPTAVRFRFRGMDDVYHWVDVRVRPFVTDDGTVDGDIASVRVVDAEVAAQHALVASEARYRLLTETAHDLIWTMTMDGRITYMSPSVEHVRGLTPAEAMAQTLEETHPPSTLSIAQDYLARLRDAIATGGALPSFHGEVEYYRKDGSTMWGELRVVPHEDPDGHGIQLLGVTRDISERKQFEDDLARLAITDTLTGMWNRRYGEELLTRAHDEARRYGTAMTLLMIDLDHFNAVNDTYGHHTGDLVLIEAASRISTHMRSTDLLIRWGGEEFLVLLPHCTATEAIDLAHKLRHVVATPPVDNIGSVTMSVGVAQLHPDDTLATWLNRADGAMYAAKARGRNTVSCAPDPSTAADRHRAGHH